MKRSQLANYPFGYYDFANGVPISDDVVRTWIKEGIKHVNEQLATGLDKAFSTRMSGNTLVIVEAYKNKSGGDYSVFVNVSTSHKYHTDFNHKLPIQ